MKKRSLMFSTAITLLFFSSLSFAQTVPTGTVNLGILESFEGYTGAGAITTAAGVTWIGDAGANIGAIGGDTIQGNVYGSDSITARCRFDLFRLYIHLNDLFVDHPATHAPAFGAGETILPGVYSIGGAGSIGGALTLDGGGDPDAFFIIKYYGALTVGAGATVNLINEAQSCNVFFIAQGAISVAASANIKGNLFAKVGAVGLGANATLEGRMLSMEGAIVAGAGSTVGPPPGTCTIPIFCESDCSPAPAVDVLGSLSNYALYTNVGAVSNTSTSGINGNIGADVGVSTGYGASIVIGSVETANDAAAQAKVDVDSAYIKLMALPNTITSHAPEFGSVAPGGETINAGVYFINGAGSLQGTLFLDAQNDPDAIFVFKFAGAFGVAAQSKMILSNGARRCNVFFIGGAGVPTGAISIGAGATLKGTFLAHGGACGSGADLFLAGRQLSTGGAVVTYTGIIYNNPECVTSTVIGGVPDIDAVEDTTDPVNGTTGGTTTSLTSNDTLNGDPVVVGEDPGNVILTGLDVPAGLTLNPNGTVTIDPNTPAGEYSVEYQICEVSNPDNCDSATSTIVVSAPDIDAVEDTTDPVNGTTG
ncbi:MAG: ice-binding family protein, partial [Flavobacteriales bacterium]